MRLILFAVWLLTFAANGEVAELTSVLENAEAKRHFYGISDSYLASKSLSQVRVAILARGFAGVVPKPEGETLKYLPDCVETVTEYPGQNFKELDPTDETGRRVAQIIWAMTGLHEDGPKIRLYNGCELSSTRCAYDQMLEWKPHIVVALEVFPTFGNFNDTGPLSPYVRVLANAGAIILHSAGETGGKVINKKISFKKNTEISHELKIHADDTFATITLSWNAFSPGRIFAGTDHDLDLALCSSDGKPLLDSNQKPIVSELRQVVGELNKDNEINLSMERLNANLFKGRYYVVVRNRSDHNDSLPYRLTVTSKSPPITKEDGSNVPAAEFVEASHSQEIGVPADSRFVVTVGSDHPWSAKGPTADNRKKPDLILDGANAFFSDKKAIDGPHVATAFFSSMVILFKARELDLKEELSQKSDEKNKLDAQKLKLTTSQVQQIIRACEKEPGKQPPDKKVSARWSPISDQKLIEILTSDP
ncbi:MAG: hypothetical protein HY537_05500 [Deltaproteobacteria bacterium]|nr:hypothetical protein [Deltaproteobacteria bacterium]